MKKSARGPLIYIIGFVLVLILIQWLTNANTTDDRDIDYDEFLSLVRQEKIEQVQITENDLFAMAKGSEINPEDKFPIEYDYYTYLPTPETFDSDIKAITGAQDTTGYGFKDQIRTGARAVVF